MKTRTGGYRSVDGLYSLHFRNVGAQVSLNTQLQGHRAGRAADTGPVETYPDDSRGGDVDKLNVATIRLHGRANQIDHLCDAVAQGWALCVVKGSLMQRADSRTENGGS